MDVQAQDILNELLKKNMELSFENAKLLAALKKYEEGAEHDG